MSSLQHVYEIRPRRDRRGFDLISDQLPLGLLWFEGPDAFGDAVSYAKFFSRSQAAIIRLFDQSGAVIETHEETGDFKEWATFKPPTQPQLMPPLAPRKPPLSKPRLPRTPPRPKLLEQKATQAQTKAEAIPAKSSFAETDAEEAFRSKSMNIAENDA
jgi:hypothetical protein